MHCSHLSPCIPTNSGKQYLKAGRRRSRSRNLVSSRTPSERTVSQLTSPVDEGPLVPATDTLPDALEPRISRAQDHHSVDHHPDLGDTYYYQWLAAREYLVAETGLISADELARQPLVLPISNGSDVAAPSVPSVAWYT